MSRRPRIVACDLDGTLVRSDGTVSDRTVKALHRAEEGGATVVFVTGRPPRWMHDVATRTGVRGLAICANGALVYDLGERRIIYSRLLPPEISQALLPRLRDAFPGIAFAAETEAGFAREPNYRARYDVGQEHRVAPAEELLAEPVAKLLARHEDMTSDELLDAAREIVGDQATDERVTGHWGKATRSASPQPVQISSGQSPPCPSAQSGTSNSRTSAHPLHQRSRSDASRKRASTPRR